MHLFRRCLKIVSVQVTLSSQCILSTCLMEFLKLFSCDFKNVQTAIICFYEIKKNIYSILSVVLTHNTAVNAGLLFVWGGSLRPGPTLSL